MHRKTVIVALTVSLAIFACKKKDEEQPAEPEKAEPAQAEPAQAEPVKAEPAATVVTDVAPLGMIVTFEVEDYDKWLTTFRDNQAMRKEAGMVGEAIFQNADNPKEVTVYLPATDQAKLDAFVASEDLKKVMAEAGVKGKPTIEMWIPKSAVRSGKATAAGVFVEHEVADYDAWRKVYDEADKIRVEAGIESHAVFQNSANPNMVGVYHEAETADILKAFLGKPELKEAMGKAGVKSEPKARFMQRMAAFKAYE